MIRDEKRATVLKNKMLSEAECLDRYSKDFAEYAKRMKVLAEILDRKSDRTPDIASKQCLNSVERGFEVFLDSVKLGKLLYDSNKTLSGLEVDCEVLERVMPDCKVK